MARKLIQYIEITDDFDRDLPADETVEVALDGQVFEIDLSSVRAKEIREFLHPYMQVAHETWKMPPRSKKKRGKSVMAQALTETPKPNEPQGYSTMMRDRDARNAIRSWARGAGGWELANTGKIPVDVLREFMEANPDAYVPESTLRDAGLSDGV